MKTVVFYDIDDIRPEDVAEPHLQEPTDAIVRLTAPAIYGIDLHFVCGSVGGMCPETILGHEGVGIVGVLGDEVRNLQAGDRVVILSTITCDNCVYCQAGYYAQCDVVNPGGSQTDIAFFGSLRANDGFHRLQAEKVRIPYVSIDLIRLPSSTSNDQTMLLSDIFPTGYFGTGLAGIAPGNTVVVFGCGLIGQFAIASALSLGAVRVFAIDRHSGRLHMVHQQGTEVTDFERKDPVQALRRPTAGIDVDRAIDAAGVDTGHSHGTTVSVPRQEDTSQNPGNVPVQALEWAVQGLAGVGTLSTIGTYAEDPRQLPIDLVMNRSLTIRMGNCHHHEYIPLLLEHMFNGRTDPAEIPTQVKPIGDVIGAFGASGRRETGWIKVELVPQKRQAGGSEKRLDERTVDELAHRPTPKSGTRG